MINRKKLFLALVLSFGLTSCSDNKPQYAGRQGSAPLPVYTFEVPEPTTSRRLSFSGISEPLNELTLSFQVSGRIIDLPARVGLHVKKDDLIGKLDPTDYKLDVERNQANLQQAIAQLQTAKANYDRTRILYEAANVSLSLLEQQYASYNTAKAQEAAAETALRNSQINLERTTLLSPDGGYLLSVSVSNYQAVSAGQTIAKLEAGGDIAMEVGLPEGLISQVHLKDHAQIIFDAFPETKLTAEVTEVGNNANAASSYSVRLKLIDIDKRVRPGMSGQAIFDFKQSSSAITIPLSAVLLDSQGEHYVWIYSPEKQTVSKRVIKIGSLVATGIEIESGLKPGDIIVSRGANNLTESVKVTELRE